MRRKKPKRLQVVARVAAGRCSSAKSVLERDSTEWRRTAQGGQGPVSRTPPSFLTPFITFHKFFHQARIAFGDVKVTTVVLSSETKRKKKKGNKITITTDISRRERRTKSDSGRFAARSRDVPIRGAISRRVSSWHECAASGWLRPRAIASPVCAVFDGRVEFLLVEGNRAYVRNPPRSRVRDQIGCGRSHLPVGFPRR